MYSSELVFRKLFTPDEPQRVSYNSPSITQLNIQACKVRYPKVSGFLINQKPKSQKKIIIFIRDEVYYRHPLNFDGRPDFPSQVLTLPSPKEAGRALEWLDGI